MTKRRTSRSNARSRKARKDRLFAVIKTIRETFQPGRHRTGGRSVSGRNRNPWPKCESCFHRVPALCEHPFCFVCPLCCPGHPDPKPDPQGAQS